MHSERDKMPVNRRLLALVDVQRLLAVGTEHRYRHLRRAVGPGHIGEPHLVFAGARQVGDERHGLAALARVVVVQIARADEVPHRLGFRPFADAFGARVIDHDARQFLGREHARGRERVLGGDEGGGGFGGGLLGFLDARLEFGDGRVVFLQRLFRVGVHGQRQLEPLRHVRVFEGLRVFENARQRVIIARRDRVELVIVAARAADGLPEERLANRVELFVHDIHDELLLVLLLEVVIADREKGRGDHLTATLRQRSGRQQIPGDLLAHETVERAVLVETLDHIIAVAPGLLEHEPAQRQRLGEPRYVEPMPPPALAEMRRREEPIDQALVRARRAIVHKGVDLPRRRRQADEIVGQTADQRHAVGIGTRPDALGLLPRADEAVEVAARPRGVGDRRHGGRGHGLIGPMFTALGDVDRPFRRHAGEARARIGRAELHPFLEVRDLLVREFALGRHAKIFVPITHGLDERAVVEIARHHSRTAVAAARPAIAVVEPQAALGFLLGAVAFVAMLGEERPDAFFKKLEARGIGRCGGGGGERRRG